MVTNPLGPERLTFKLPACLRTGNHQVCLERWFTERSALLGYPGLCQEPCRKVLAAPHLADGVGFHREFDLQCLGSIVLFRCTYPLLSSILKLKWHLLSVNTCFLKLLQSAFWPVKMSHGEADEFPCFLAGAPDGFAVYQEEPQTCRLPLNPASAQPFSCCLPHHGRLFTLSMQFLLVSPRVTNAASMALEADAFQHKPAFSREELGSSYLLTKAFFLMQE